MIKLFEPYHPPEDVAALTRVLQSGWTAYGTEARAFEIEWQRYTNAQWSCLFVSSATAGLHLALRVLRADWADGDEVISTPLTFVSTNHVILHERLKPVFADVGKDLCLDPDSVQERITPRTRAVMFVGLGGTLGRLSEIADLCAQRGLKLIVDAAHMAGTRPLPEGDAVVYSFQSVKNLSCGDGGMLCFPNTVNCDRARKLAWLGIDRTTFNRSNSDGYSWRYDVNEVGWKYLGNDLAAALGRSGLKRLDRDNAYRRQIAAWYDELQVFKSVPHTPGSARHLYQILVPDRERVRERLMVSGVQTGVHYRYNGDYPMYADQPDCPWARQMSDLVLSLPMHVGLSRLQVNAIVRKALKAL